jgi:hypothetical protein
MSANNALLYRSVPAHRINSLCKTRINHGDGTGAEPDAMTSMLRRIHRCREFAAFKSNDGRMTALFDPTTSAGIGKSESGPPIGRRSMGSVMIKCPGTGRDIATGLVADRESFAAMPVFFARVFCPLCRTEHEWFAQEAWVCEAAAPERTPLMMPY